MKDTAERDQGQRQGVPGWERFPWLRAGFSTRLGGRSVVYGGQDQNLGWTAEDDPETVAQDRHTFLALLGAEPTSLVTATQVHGSEILDLPDEPGPWMTPEGRALQQGDGLISTAPGRFVGIVTADCVPVLIADTRRRTVGAFHAGWRGTLAGIVRRGTGLFRERHGADPRDLVAAIGPSIRSCCFAIGPEVREAFLARDPTAATLFQQQRLPGSEIAQWTMDLQEANRRQLVQEGLSPEAIEVLAECTACTRLADDSRRYFSYRAEGGVTGRMLNVIGIAPERV